MYVVVDCATWLSSLCRRNVPDASDPYVSESPICGRLMHYHMPCCMPHIHYCYSQIDLDIARSALQCVNLQIATSSGRHGRLKLISVHFVRAYISGFLICLENPLVNPNRFRLPEISDRFRLLSRIWSPVARISPLGRHRSKRKPFPIG